MSLVILGTALVLWAAVHSWLASQQAKAFASRSLGTATARVYRLGYNVFAAVTFLPVLVLMRWLPDTHLYTAPPPWAIAMLLGQAAAALCLLLALLQTDALHFAGLRQLSGATTASELNTSGFYGLVRHPLYLFGLVFLWLTPVMTANMLTVYAVLTIYIFVGAAFEERRLLREFGEEYQRYRQRVPMIIPVPRGRRTAG